MKICKHCGAKHNENYEGDECYKCGRELPNPPPYTGPVFRNLDDITG